MTDTDKVPKPKMSLDTLPDWVKVIVFALASFGAAGGGSQVLGKDYSKDFEKLDTRLQRIEMGASADHDDLVRLKTKVEQLESKIK